MALRWAGRPRILLRTYGGIGLGSFSWAASYVLWVQKGCVRFMPFVSDFGAGPSEWLFGLGMAAAAVLLIPAWFDYYEATKLAFSLSSNRWRRLHSCVPFMGTWCSASILCVALNPWNQRLTLHMIGAFGIFGGGVAFAFLVGLLDYHRGLPVGRFLAAACTAAVAGLLMMYFVFKALFEREGPEAAMRRVEKSKQLMEHSFEQYCAGEHRSLHHIFDVNAAAACEWVLLGTLLCMAAIKLHEELGSQSASKEDGQRQSSLLASLLPLH
ncbi:unnamed protein product [Polarella glacialis]|uniref:Uncharacterized protein n=1 Tax=Polarella glacialis TaxID=89957 RepID=A0A813H5J7_POLGL|nr:unnamed protein product [Polarella glacialis]